MFFEYSKGYNPFDNDTVRRCFLGKVTKLYKCCNIAPDCLVGYLQNSGDAHYADVEKYIVSKKRERVSWMMQEVPCLMLSMDTLQVGLCIEHYNSEKKRFRVEGIGLKDIIKNIEKYVCNKMTIAGIEFNFYKLESDIIVDNMKIICPASLPYRKYKSVKDGFESTVNDEFNISKYFHMISKINIALAEGA